MGFSLETYPIRDVTETNSLLLNIFQRREKEFNFIKKPEKLKIYRSVIISKYKNK